MLDFQKEYIYEYRAIKNYNKALKIYSNYLEIESESEFSFDIKNSKPSALDQFATAIISSIIYSIIDYDKRNSKAIEAIEIKTKMRLKSPLSKINVIGIDDDKPKIDKMEFNIYVDNVLEDENIGIYCLKGMENSILLNSLKNSISFVFDIANV
ncbi:hypothetical protein SCHIN_v1c03270 [Spiroplasma chinense]|uniref:Uncharacterized protein n=1 Tax=Spiroplasma chinense TaxID=216932 RepID=A0A5B9Y3C1_9MOLU|nr:hypothetical protein [Spiroplasma chinense]QEH61524.1 hypothetical protein SCHIN_v1c03270 [Spiroplasma chinense]